MIPSSIEVKVRKLKRRVDALSKALHLILFEEAMALPRKEMDGLKERLSAYVHGKRTEFDTIGHSRQARFLLD